MPNSFTQAQIEQFTPLIPHLQEATTTLQPWLTDANLIKPSTRIAQFYNGQAAYAEALPWYQHCLEIAETHLGADHPATATSLNNLAGLYESQGRYGEAEPLYVRSLQIREQQLGADHPDTASSLNNLAGLYRAQGRYGEAEPLYLGAVVILCNCLGQEHPSTQTVWNNFLSFLAQVIAAGQTAPLSDHPLTQELLRQMQEGSEE